ncbi:histidine phosphotransferase family protein [Roseococcus sp. DSY-14]|uniref:histidine phosphotransferase family protein n=1 Tax=Roseococcus sp. DSY-14 TaxID=3369650 RepID=UPI00387B80FF
MKTPEIRLAELVAARLCHDIGSPLSTLTAIMPQAAEPAAHALLSETAVELRQRHRLFCLCFGGGDDLAWDDLAEALRGAPMAHRVRFAFGPGPRHLGAATGRLVLAAALLAAESLPRGGEVRLAHEDGAFLLRAEGRDQVWPEALLRLVAGDSMDAILAEGPRWVLSPWVWSLARAEFRDVAFLLGADGGAPALRIAAPA